MRSWPQRRRSCMAQPSAARCGAALTGPGVVPSRAVRAWNARLGCHSTRRCSTSTTAVVMSWCVEIDLPGLMLSPPALLLSLRSA